MVFSGRIYQFLSSRQATGILFTHFIVSHPQIAQAWMSIGTAADRPVKFAIGLIDRQMIDAREPKPHQAIISKFPVFIPIGTGPVPRVVSGFVCEAHGDAVAVKSP
jgi:hypothetical protein